MEGAANFRLLWCPPILLLAEVVENIIAMAVLVVACLGPEVGYHWLFGWLSLSLLPLSPLSWFGGIVIAFLALLPFFLLFLWGCHCAELRENCCPLLCLHSPFADLEENCFRFQLVCLLNCSLENIAVACRIWLDIGRDTRRSGLWSGDLGDCSFHWTGLRLLPGRHLKLWTAGRGAKEICLSGRASQARLP